LPRSGGLAVLVGRRHFANQVGVADDHERDPARRAEREQVAEPLLALLQELQRLDDPAPHLDDRRRAEAGRECHVSTITRERSPRQHELFARE